MSPPGMLYVTMQPKYGLPPAQFHEWYNNEHGPTRLRLPQIFSNGLRYQATDGKEPAYLAAYDVTSMAQLETETYLTLRANRSPREASTISQVDVKRYFWDLVAKKQSPLFLPIEQLSDEQAEGIVLVAVELGLKEHPNSEQEIQKWYEEEHFDMLSKVPGWLRSRLLKISSLETGVPTTFISLHEYAKENGIGGEQHKAAMSTARHDEILARYGTPKDRRTYSLFYVFGPGPRDLSSLSQLPTAASTFTSADAKTTTTNEFGPVIKSYVTAPDGLSIPYQLEGNPDPNAPTIAFCNSLLTSLHMWDPFVEILRAKRPKYRILRYDTRGRNSVPSPPVPSTLDTVADDLSHLLEALRIPKLDTLLGVSMGGATTLKFALKYPAKLEKFIACDFNAVSSPANTQAWKDRITVAETPLEDGAPGITKLAGVTVERWFHPATMKKTDVVQWMTDMVAANDIEGFRYGCQALWDYDMKDQMNDCKVAGLFVVGEGDGKGALVKAMDGFRALLGQKGAHLAIVPEAGHLPMCEAPGAFWEAVQDSL
ncbi:Alpha/Beta hydrolase protein [Pseudomassariella vexata]|uniref:Alpha/Beta hydrolase protein n=1 Tax=Pseudomassariella vexata TaxID=1141098 RepID=A0A1Y2DLE8_9PEZI|nr:Alpha/Beta hydrolase protein [Pseudomassariella vexata]ORY60067.1 Alpha/Beta hydrolase protein [Pseudomassariella vexata]